jgi:hypothetical protein
VCAVCIRFQVFTDVNPVNLNRERVNGGKYGGAHVHENGLETILERTTANLLVRQEGSIVYDIRPPKTIPFPPWRDDPEVPTPPLSSSYTLTQGAPRPSPIIPPYKTIYLPFGYRPTIAPWVLPHYPTAVASGMIPWAIPYIQFAPHAFHNAPPTSARIPSQPIPTYHAHEEPLDNEEDEDAERKMKLSQAG